MLQSVISRLSVENFLSQSTETFLRGTLLCCVSETCWKQKSLRIGRREGGVWKFLSKIFSIKVPRNFLGEAFSLSLISCIGNVYVSECYVTIFRRKFSFLSYSTETFRRDSFSLQLISGIEKNYASKGYVTTFYRNFFVPQYRNIS